MCAKGASCGCGSASGSVAAILAGGVLLAVVAGIATIISDILEAVAVIMIVGVPAFAGLLFWRVKYLTRPALVSRETVTRPALPPAPPKAIEATQTLPVLGVVLSPEKVGKTW